jgi:hypothetical protein
MNRIAAAAALVIAAGLVEFGAGGVAIAADNASVTVVLGIPSTALDVTLTTADLNSAPSGVPTGSGGLAGRASRPGSS